MKKILKIGLIVFLVICGISIFLLESSYSLKFAQQIIQKELLKKNLDFKIGKIDGTLVEKIQITDLQLGTIKASFVEFKLSLPSLLKGKIQISNLDAFDVYLDTPEKILINSPLHILGSISFYRSGKGKANITIQTNACKDSAFHFVGKWDEKQVAEASFDVAVLDLNCLFNDLNGPLQAKGHLNGSIQNWIGKIEGNWNRSIHFASQIKSVDQTIALKNLTIKTPIFNATSDLSLKQLENEILISLKTQAESQYGKQTADFAGKYQNQAISGNLEVLGDFQKELWTIKSPLFYRFGGALNLSELKIVSNHLEGSGDMTIRPDGILIGSFSWDKGDLTLLSYHGKTHGSIYLSAENEEQVIQLRLKAEEIYIDDGYAKEANLEGRYTQGAGSVIASFEDLNWKQINLDLISAQFGWDECKSTPFCFYAIGNFKGPLEIEGGGEFDFQSKLIRLDWGQGLLFNLPLYSKKSAVFQWNSNRHAIENVSLLLGSAEINMDFLGFLDSSRANCTIKNLPLDLITPSKIVGVLNFEGAISDTSGQFRLELPTGTLKGHAQKNTLQIDADGFAKGYLKLPFEYSLFPLKADVKLDQQIHGKIEYTGKIEDLLDPLDLGSHHFNGICQMDFAIDGTLLHPELYGFLKLSDAGYQNYWSGTELINGKCLMEATGDQIAIKHVLAQDALEMGTLEGKGSILLDTLEKFPYQADFHLNNLKFTELNILQAFATGSGEYKGNFAKAKVIGSFGLHQGIFMIPDRLSKELPHLQVVYKNVDPLKKPIFKEKRPSLYPVDLSIKLYSTEDFVIEGRGLKSDWEGNFMVGGTVEDVSFKGKIDLTGGEFVFSGRTFKLIDGSISMNGEPNKAPELNIAGVWTEKDVAITVRLKGPLNEPQITFQSNPPLPLNGILSYLLFGQDISEITAFQALQLVNSAATISGGSPDILETTRKSLGVDRLRIISRPSLGEGDDSIALQVGQYVAEGVIISVSQGPEQSSTNISIEVDLSKGFVFQAETLQEEEQGKFTIKWNRNY